MLSTFPTSNICIVLMVIEFLNGPEISWNKMMLLLLRLKEGLISQPELAKFMVSFSWNYLLNKRYADIDTTFCIKI